MCKVEQLVLLLIFLLHWHFVYTTPYKPYDSSYIIPDQYKNIEYTPTLFTQLTVGENLTSRSAALVKTLSEDPQMMIAVSRAASVFANLPQFPLSLLDEYESSSMNGDNGALDQKLGNLAKGQAFTMSLASFGSSAGASVGGQKGNIMTGVPMIFNSIVTGQATQQAPTTADVILAVNSRIDESTSAILTSIQTYMVGISVYISTQTRLLVAQLIDNNLQAAFREIITETAILEFLNLRRTASKELEEPILYEIFPCGSAMTLCNNAFLQVAASIQDILTAVYDKAVFEEKSEYFYVYAHGSYFLQLLYSSIFSLVNVNTLYATTNIPNFATLPDDNLYSNAIELQEIFQKAFSTYQQMIEICEHSRQASSLNLYNKGVTSDDSNQVLYGAYNKLLKGVVTDRTFNNLQQMHYSQGHWSQLQPLPMQDIERSNPNKQTNTLSMTCPKGSFLIGYLGLLSMFRCAFVVGADVRQYGKNMTESFTSNGATDGRDYQANCSDPGYYIVQIQHSQRSASSTLIITCAIPKYLSTHEQCTLIRWFGTSQVFLVLDNELLNVDQHINGQNSIFIDSPAIIDFEAFHIDYGPQLDTSAYLVQRESSQYYLVTKASIRQIVDKNTLATCQFNINKALQLKQYQGQQFDSLPKEMSLNASVTTFVNRITNAKLLQESSIPGQITNYTILFQNSNPLPRTTSFEILLTKEITTATSITNCSLQISTLHLEMKCQVYNMTVFITGDIQNRISPQTSMALTFGPLYNPFIQEQRFSPTILRIYADPSFTNFIETSLPQMMLPELLCNWPCSICSPNNKDECQQCIPYPFWNSTIYLSKGTCVTSCTLSYFESSSGIRHCLDTCHSGQYQLGTKCYNCSKKCLTCSQDGCLSCDTSSYFPYMYHQDCLNYCPIYTTPIKGLCTKCDFNCLSCSLSPSDCTTCIIGFHLDNGQCLRNCPPGQYLQNDVCSPCHSSCFSCIGSLESQCTSCYQDSLLKYLAQNNTCVSQCASGLSPIDGMCTMCGLGCITCNETSCTSCKEEFTLQNGKCREICISPMYPVKNGQSACNFCDNNCLVCQASSQCLVCDQSSDTPLLVNGLCLKNDLLNSNTQENICETGYFFTNNSCQKCHYTCQSCTGFSNQCTSCYAQSVFPFLLANYTCSNVCPVGTILVGNSCKPCGHGCQQCSQTQCLQCDNVSFFLGGRCASRCPLTEFLMESECKKCSDSCLLCSDELNCIMCDQYGQKPLLRNGTCISLYEINRYLGESQSQLGVWNDVIFNTYNSQQTSIGQKQLWGNDPFLSFSIDIYSLANLLLVYFTWICM